MFLNSAFHIITHYIFQSTYEAMDIFQIVSFKYEFKSTHTFFSDGLLLIFPSFFEATGDSGLWCLFYYELPRAIPTASSLHSYSAAGLSSLPLNSQSKWLVCMQH